MNTERLHMVRTGAGETARQEAGTMELDDLIRRAEAGEAEAQYELGVCYAEGRDVPRDLEQTALWMGRAAEQNHAQAQYELAQMHRLGVFGQVNIEESARLARLAAEGGHMLAAVDLGKCLRSGTGVERNAEEAARWYRIAADAGVPEGILNLANCYKVGDGVPRDMDMACRLFRAAEEISTPLAERWAGEPDVKPLEVEFHGAQWVLMVKQAFGGLYVMGYGAEEDASAEWKLLIQTAQRGNLEALPVLCREMALSEEEGHEERAKRAGRVLVWASQAGFLPAIHEVCLWLLHGWGGFPKAPEFAATNLFGMTFHGYAPAMRSMGQCYFTGAGVPQNRTLGLAFFMSAAERGDSEAARFLGRSLLFGEGMEQDHEQAVKWLRTAAQQDDPESLYLLGLAHVKGWGVARDTAWGKELIKTAAAKGCPEAVQALKDLRKKPHAN